MNVVARRTLVAYWEEHPETKGSLVQWLARARWRSMGEVMRDFPRARAVSAERVRFEVAGGNYRLIVAFKFSAGIAFIKFIGTRAEYDRIDAPTVSRY